MDFVGKRADKYTVVDSKVGTGKKGDGIRRKGVVKHVEYYTVTCDECDGTGYYNDIGEIICDGCGLVLSGDAQPVINTEFSEGNKNSIGRGRGLEKMHDRADAPHDPSI